MSKRNAILAAVVAVIAIAIAALWILRPSDRVTGEAPPPIATGPVDVVERGRQLALIANCQACHTARGGAPYAGGHAIPTPFGTFHAPNITPDAESGIGEWSADDFWLALHDGRAPDGRLLYPTFPYTNYTKISRTDADAIYAYLRTVEPVRRTNVEHDLRFPYNQRWALAAWRTLFFRPGVYEADPAKDAAWNRGAYLVQGLAHCSACHEARNSLGAIQSSDNPSGGLVLNWYAPSLSNPREAGLAHWSEDDVVALLRDGRTSPQGSAPLESTLGPMAEVVYASLQHVDEPELRAIATYLRSIADDEPPPRGTPLPAPDTLERSALARGAGLYAEHCATCHGDAGEGRRPAAPALAGTRGVCMDSSVNPIRVVLYGGYPPGTEGNPRPFGMPPFFNVLDDGEIASVLNYLRDSCADDVPAVRARVVERSRSGGPLW